MSLHLQNAIPVEKRNLHIANLPKRHLVNFLEATAEKPNEEYIFVLQKCTVAQAKVFVHRMRVDLSRKKQALLENGYRVPPFAMLVKSYSFNPLKNATTITLSRENNNRVNEFANLLSATKGDSR